ncbi:MAG TPA: hypothetical protein P5191_09160 [Ruminococcus sp.]|nr:hypothetical protein [Ruminococcus sp.]
MTKNRFRLDPLNARFRIRNGITGGYIHITLFRILEFPTRSQAIAYMNRNGLNKEIYYAEAVIM